MKKRVHLVLTVLCGLLLVLVSALASAEPVGAPSAAASSAEVASAAPAVAPSAGKKLSGADIYQRLRSAARGEDGGKAQFDALRGAAASLSWEGSAERSVLGHIRLLVAGGTASGDAQSNEPFPTDELFLIRELDSSVFVLAMPKDAAALKADAGGPYADLHKLLKYKLRFQVQTASAVIDGVSYDFVRLVKAPERLMLDRLFFIAIVLLLFLVMVGMGLTLTLREFAVVFKKPRGMIVGTVLQFGLLPFVAMVLGRLAGFYDAYPFIFFGLILVASSPGGVTSNLMTYLGKGDVALSVSLTAVCTVLSIVFTPLLLTLYGSNIPEFSVPVVDVAKTMLVLVVVPLFVGMVIRGKAERFAKKAEKPFALLGVVALLFLIVVGIWTNLDKFADTDRYGPKFYGIIFLLTLLGMVIAAVVSKAVRINNYQTRAISLEVGLRNASLSMTIALLLQDQLGDFASSMFFASGIFGLWMYFAGAVSIFGFKKLLPVDASEIEGLKPGETAAEEAGG